MPIPYQKFLLIAEAWWAWHMLGGLANTLALFGVAVATCLLAPVRGAVWATVGATLTAVGGAAFGAGLAAEAASYAYAADLHSEELLTHVTEHPERYVTVILPGLALMTLGAIVISVALWRARTVPLWVPITLLAGTVLPLVTPWSTAGSVIGLAATVATVAIGWYAWRPTSI
ncbi:MAG: hypothetical protein ACRDT6_27785 [Micromonosporaceae bacterium]